MNERLASYLEQNDYAKTAQDCAAWIKDWFAANGPQSPAVIGLSGGKDSSIVAALCVKALGVDRVFGVLMPNGTQSDIDVARRIAQHLGIKSAEVNIAPAFGGLSESIEGAGIELSKQSVINMPPRIRMAALYAVSQSMGGRVSNNSNRSEKYVGYSTIFGDSAGDFSPLSNLTVTEVKEVGRALGLPDEFIEKPPSDGLTGKTDEDNIGFTYEMLDTYILTGSSGDEALDEKIKAKHEANLFKLQPMPAFRP